MYKLELIVLWMSVNGLLTCSSFFLTAVFALLIELFSACPRGFPPSAGTRPRQTSGDVGRSKTRTRKEKETLDISVNKSQAAPIMLLLSNNLIYVYNLQVLKL